VRATHNPFSLSSFLLIYCRSLGVGAFGPRNILNYLHRLQHNVGYAAQRNQSVTFLNKTEHASDPSNAKINAFTEFRRCSKNTF